MSNVPCYTKYLCVETKFTNHIQHNQNICTAMPNQKQMHYDYEKQWIMTEG